MRYVRLASSPTLGEHNRKTAAANSPRSFSTGSAALARIGYYYLAGLEKQGVSQPPGVVVRFLQTRCGASASSYLTIIRQSDLARRWAERMGSSVLSFGSGRSRTRVGVSRPPSGSLRPGRAGGKAGRKRHSRGHGGALFRTHPVTRCHLEKLVFSQAAGGHLLLGVPATYNSVHRDS